MSPLKPSLVAILITLIPSLAFATVKGDLWNSKGGPETPEPNESFLYASKNSTEAVMTFRYQVEILSPRQPSQTTINEKIERQLNHLFGPMSVGRYTGVPKGDHQISQLTLAKAAPGVYLAAYTYTGLVVFKSGPTDYFVTLPRNPDTIYGAALVNRRGEAYNPCTDDHYQSEGDFWYFWNPNQQGCPLREGIHYDRVPMRLARRMNTTMSYPEYERLADERGEIRISVLMGMDDAAKGRDPMTSRDENAANFREIRRVLMTGGYAPRIWSNAEIRQVLTANVRQLPHVEELAKDTPTGRIVVVLFFGPSGIDENSRAFHYFLKDAMENSSVMIYDGHSGLGGHLDLAAIEQAEGFRIQPHRSRYQIYFFNSCSSYTYYNTMFFGRKAGKEDPRGTKNLDILTNGLATYFNVMHDTNLALLEAIDLWAHGKRKVSYQQLANRIDSNNLFGVNGDEDNPRR